MLPPADSDGEPGQSAHQSKKLIIELACVSLHADNPSSVSPSLLFSDRSGGNNQTLQILVECSEMRAGDAPTNCLSDRPQSEPARTPQCGRCLCMKCSGTQLPSTTSIEAVASFSRRSTGTQGPCLPSLHDSTWQQKRNLK